MDLTNLVLLLVGLVLFVVVGRKPPIESVEELETWTTIEARTKAEIGRLLDGGDAGGVRELRE